MDRSNRRGPRRSLLTPTMVSTAALLLLLACRRKAPAPPAPAAPHAASALPAASVRDAATDEPPLSVDSQAAADAPWVELNTHEQKNPEPTKAGLVVRPRIELPSRALPEGSAGPWSIDLVPDLVFMPIRTRGLPAMSRDGSRVAHVYAPYRCCRGTGYAEFSLYVFDSRSGALKKKLLLWTLEDEARLPQRDQTEAARTRPAPPGVRREMTEEAFQANLRAYERVLGARSAAANAELAGEWVTLAALPREGDERFAGEGFSVRLAPEGAFPPLEVERSGRRTPISTAPWKISSRSCPPESMRLSLMKGYALRDRPWVLLETAQGFNAPDGCEGSSVHLVPLPSE